MKFTAPNSSDTTNFLADPRVLTMHDRLNTKVTKSNHEMSPKAIAEEVSNHLMDFVRKQFSTAKKGFEGKMGKK